MAFVLADRVKDSTTTTGTGAVTLSGTAPTGFQNFGAIGNTNSTYYCIQGQGTAEWEVGIGTYTAAGTIFSRDTVLASSNAGSLVTFSAGTKDVFCDLPASWATGRAASGANSDITSLSSLASINGGQIAGFRNLIINGGGVVSQYGSVAAVNNTVTYGGADRIAVAPASFTTVSGTITQWNAGVLTSTGYGQQLASVTTTGTGTISFYYRAEAKDAFHLNGKTITYSALLYQDTGSALNAVVISQKANAADNFSSVTTISTSGATSIQSGVATRITFTTTLGAADATNGIQFIAQFQGVGAVTTKNFAIGDVQVELGSVATPFEFKNYNTEYSNCRRYYRLVAVSFVGSVTSTLTYGGTIPGAEDMRVIPTATWVSSYQLNGFANSAGTFFASVAGIGYYKAASASTNGGSYTDQIKLSAEL
jgi:hypothetical protein